MADASAWDKRTYWAAESDLKRLIGRAIQRHQDAIQRFARSGRMIRAARLLAAYLGRGVDAMRDSSTLLDGDVTEWHVNNVRPVVTTALGLIAGRRPAVKPRARNTDATALAATRLALKLHESAINDASGEELELTTVRYGLLASSWTLGLGWAPKDGAVYGVDESGQPQHDGSIHAFTLPPWRVSFDPTAADADARRWGIFIRPLSRFDLIAQLEGAQEPTAVAAAQRLRDGADGTRPAGTSYASVISGFGFGHRLAGLDALLEEELPAEDAVWVWEVRHRPSPALPVGRLVRFVDEETVLFDGSYPYDATDLLLEEFCPERVGSGTAGHTGMFDLAGSQELLDVCTTAMATSINLNGASHMWTPDADSEPLVNTLGRGGPKLISTPTKPEVLEMPVLQPEMLTAAEFAKAAMESSAALNATVMGRPEKGMPASAQALQRAQALEFHQVSQASYVRLVKRVANARLRLWKRFARSPRELGVGQGDSYEVMQWQADSLQPVEQFDVEPINPQSQSYEARQAQAEMLAQSGVVKSPVDLLTFLQTGSLPKVTDFATKQAEIAEAQQQALMSGKGLPPVDMVASQEAGIPVFVDDGGDHLRILAAHPHHLCIQGFVTLLNGTTDVDLIRRTQEAIDYSLTLWRSLDADACEAYGLPPLPSHLGMMPMEAAGEIPEGHPTEEPSEMPAPPENPISGDKAPPVPAGPNA